MTCMACANLFDVDELAGKVVGLVAGALVDKEKRVSLTSLLLSF
jgi:SCY1-like protein 1